MVEMERKNSLPPAVKEALNNPCLLDNFTKTVKAFIEIILSTEKLEPEVAQAIYYSYMAYSYYCKLTGTFISRRKELLRSQEANGCQDIHAHFEGADLLVTAAILSKVTKPSRFSLTGLKIGKIVEAYTAQFKGKTNKLNIQIET